MTFSRKQAVLALFSLVALACHDAYGQLCTNVTPTEPYVVVNAASGGLEIKPILGNYDDKTVQLVVKNKNPFAYKYTLSITEELIEEDAPLAFLEAFFGGPLATVQPDSAREETVAPQRSSLRGAPPTDDPLRTCPNWWAQRVRDASSERERIGDQVRPAIDAANSQVDKVDAARKTLQEQQPRLLAPGATCESLDAAINGIKGIDIAGVAGPIDRATHGVNAMRQAVSAQTIVNSGLSRDLETLQRANALDQACATASLSSVFGDKVYYTGLESMLGRAADSLAAQIATVGAVTKAQQEVAKVLGDSITDRREIGGHQDPTRVTVSLTRQPLAPPNAPTESVVNREFLFGGGPRFILGIGAFFADLDSNEFGRVPTVTGTDANGTPIIVNTIDRLKTASHRRSSMVLLHSRFNKRWYLSLGVTVESDAEEDDTEMFIGTSWSFANGQGFLSMGAYEGTTHTLGDGLNEGDVIPDAIGTIPIREKDEFAFAVGISYGIRIGRRE